MAGGTIQRLADMLEYLRATATPSDQGTVPQSLEEIILRLGWLSV